jgi:hypothetical protein
MSSDFNWIVEYETLPPGDSPLPEPPAPPPRRRPRWFDPAAGLAAVCLGALLLYLWLLGGKADPLPSPDPPIARLEAAVLMEISALRNGDDELFRQVQDRSSRRSNYQPPPEAWFTGGRHAGAAGAIELIDLQLIDEDSARAEVRLTWTGSLYDLTWFYRQSLSSLLRPTCRSPIMPNTGTRPPSCSARWRDSSPAAVHCCPAPPVSR